MAQASRARGDKSSRKAWSFGDSQCAGSRTRAACSRTGALGFFLVDEGISAFEVLLHDGLVHLRDALLDLPWLWSWHLWFGHSVEICIEICRGQ